MKYGLLSYDEFKEFGGQNIGDYVQSLAAKQFIPERSEILYVKRDHLNEYNGDPIKLIMNGWFSHIPENFKPSDKIIPLFIAFHLNSTVKDKILTPENITYLKKYEPIGCRDKYTANLLNEKGIKAYFSGCLTLTLGMKYKNEHKTDDVYFIDPFIGTDVSIFAIVNSLLISFPHYLLLKRIQKNMIFQKGIKGYIKASLFYTQYSKIFGKNVLKKAKYLHNQYHCDSEEEYFKSAENLINLYSSAKLVVTSRIHAALPCTGLETPVIFINNLNDSELSTCRFDGLIDLFNVINHDGKKLINNNDIKISNIKINQRYKILKENMEKTCSDFMNSGGF